MSRYRTVESEKDEQSFEARIWWVFWIVAIVVLVYTAWHQYHNYDLVHNGKCIEAEYFVYNNQKIARYHDENGMLASKNLDGLNAIHEENTVKLYYKDSMSYAEPEQDIKSWLYSYFIFIPVLAGTSWKLYTIYKKKPSTEIYPE